MYAVTDMMRGFLLRVILLCLATRAVAWSHATQGELQTALRDKDHVLVAFVLESQDASEALEPEWTSVQATERDSTILSFDCAAESSESLDATQNEEEDVISNRQRNICFELDVASFPAIRLYRKDGTMERYRGPRRAYSITQFLRRSLRPTLTTLNIKNTNSFLAIDDVVVVAHLHTSNTNLQARFASLAAELRDRYTFATMDASSSSAARVRCYNNLNDDIALMSAADLEAGGVGALRQFVEGCAEPLIPELGRRNEMTYLAMGKSLVHYFVTTEVQRQAYFAAVRPLAKKYREYLVFTTIDAHEYPEMRAALGLGEGVGSGLAVQNPANGDVFPYVGGTGISAETVEAFLLDIIAGKVKPWGGPGVEGARHDEL